MALAPASSYAGAMTTGRWLQLGTAITALLLLIVLALAWNSAVEDRRRANDIGARVSEQMNRIEAEAARIENASR